MNDKDKEAFEKAWLDSTVEDYRGLGNGKTSIASIAVTSKRRAAEMLWQAACDYKQKEIEALQAEIAKLKKSLNFTLKAAEYLFKPDEKIADGLFPTSYFTLSYEGDLELIEKTKRARQVLKELDEK